MTRTQLEELAKRLEEHWNASELMKEAAALVRTPAGLIPLNRSEPASSAEITALEARYAQLWRLYMFVPDRYAARTAPAAHEIFGYRSDYQRG